MIRKYEVMSELGECSLLRIFDFLSIICQNSFLKTSFKGLRDKNITITAVKIMT